MIHKRSLCLATAGGCLALAGVFLANNNPVAAVGFAGVALI